MPEQLFTEEVVRFIKEIELFFYITQRILSANIGIPLGKTDYLLKKFTYSFLKRKGAEYNNIKQEWRRIV